MLLLKKNPDGENGGFQHLKSVSPLIVTEKSEEIGAILSVSKSDHVRQFLESYHASKVYAELRQSPESEGHSRAEFHEKKRENLVEYGRTVSAKLFRILEKTLKDFPEESPGEIERHFFAGVADELQNVSLMHRRMILFGMESLREVFSKRNEFLEKTFEDAGESIPATLKETEDAINASPELAYSFWVASI